MHRTTNHLYHFSLTPGKEFEAHLLTLKIKLFNNNGILEVRTFDESTIEGVKLAIFIEGSQTLYTISRYIDKALSNINVKERLIEGVLVVYKNAISKSSGLNLICNNLALFNNKLESNLIIENRNVKYNCHMSVLKVSLLHSKDFNFSIEDKASNSEISNSELSSYSELELPLNIPHLMLEINDEALDIVLKLIYKGEVPISLLKCKDVIALKQIISLTEEWKSPFLKELALYSLDLNLDKNNFFEVFNIVKNLDLSDCFKAFVGINYNDICNDDKFSKLERDEIVMIVRIKTSN